MVESLADIEVLAMRCRSEQSKAYVYEAIRCYQAGAYRAAIVSTWIAVVFDLIDKIRELALSGNAEARNLEARYEGYIAQIEQNNPNGIKSALEFERNILDLCRDKLQFFDSHQFTDLARLRDDRHRCAHPSYQGSGLPYSPSPEQARLHIRNAVAHVLSQAPVQGKAALAALESLVGSAYFPTDVQQAKAQLKESSLKNGTEALVKGFIDKLVFGFLKEGDTLFYKVQVYAATNALYEMYPGIAEERLRKQLNTAVKDVPDKHFPAACALVLSISPAWGVLESTAKDKIAQFVEKGNAPEVLRFLNALSQYSELQSTIENRMNRLSFEELAEAVNSHGLLSLAKGRALQILSEVRSWDRANEVFSKVVLPLFNCFSEQDIERIIRMPVETSADLPGAHGYSLFIAKVRQAGLIDNQKLNVLLAGNKAAHLAPQIETEQQVHISEVDAFTPF